jgi:hypothetical protein
MRAARGWIPVVLFVLGGSLLQACSFVGDVLSGTRDRIIFSHKQHLDMKGLSGRAAEKKMCAACHFATPNDPRGEEPGDPLEASCLVCHGEWKQKGDCGKCHTDPQKPLTYGLSTHPKILFSHARHDERIERLEDRACAYCHETAWEEGDDTAGVRLNQDAEERWHGICFRCHLMRTEWEKMSCGKCHTTVSDIGGPRPLSRFHHDGEWLQQHGDQLIGRPDGIVLCAKCHDRGYCQDCHDARDERRVRPELKWPDRPDRKFIHRGDYVNRHAFEARENPADCIRCHAVGSFCKNCHEQRGLSIATRYVNQTQTGDRNYFRRDNQPVQSILQYHNGSYAEFMAPTSPLFHGRTARRDAVLCATCHDQGRDSVCMDCHADTNVKGARIQGGNPHPPGFKSAIPKNARPCSYCHVYAGGR